MPGTKPGMTADGRRGTLTLGDGMNLQFIEDR
jgi:hypothetical protein